MPCIIKLTKLFVLYYTTFTVTYHLHLCESLILSCTSIILQQQLAVYVFSYLSIFVWRTAIAGSPVVSLQPGSFQDPGEAVYPRPLAHVVIVEGWYCAAARCRRHHLHTVLSSRFPSKSGGECYSFAIDICLWKKISVSN